MVLYYNYTNSLGSFYFNLCVKPVKNTGFIEAFYFILCFCLFYISSILFTLITPYNKHYYLD